MLRTMWEKAYPYLLVWVGGLVVIIAGPVLMKVPPYSNANAVSSGVLCLGFMLILAGAFKLWVGDGKD